LPDFEVFGILARVFFENLLEFFDSLSLFSLSFFEKWPKKA